MRVRNQRTGKWIELPDDDGLVSVYVRRRDGSKHWELWEPERVKRASNFKLELVDNLPIQQRWRYNYFLVGNGDKTTPSFQSFALASVEDLL